VPGLSTVRSRLSERERLLNDLRVYLHSAKARELRDAGGSGFSEVLPHDRQVHLQQIKRCQQHIFKFHLDFAEVWDYNRNRMEAESVERFRMEPKKKRGFC
jgi:hypothetical protein